MLGAYAQVDASTIHNIAHAMQFLPWSALPSSLTATSSVPTSSSWLSSGDFVVFLANGSLWSWLCFWVPASLSSPGAAVGVTPVLRFFSYLWCPSFLFVRSSVVVSSWCFVCFVLLALPSVRARLVRARPALFSLLACIQRVSSGIVAVSTAPERGAMTAAGPAQVSAPVNLATARA